MILEKIQLVKNVKKFVTRICDECGKKERARMGTVLKGRESRNKDIDLCKKCASSRKYKPKSNWPINEKSHLWKGGRRKSSCGIRIHISPGKWIYEHRKVMEEHIGRELLSTEIVHHINMDKYDNDIGNLYLCKDNYEHGRIHQSLEVIGYSLLGRKIWFDYYNKKYVLHETEIPSEKEKEIKLDINFNLHILKRTGRNGVTTSYHVYHKPIGNGGYKKVYLHVDIIENFLGRKLFRNEVIHHIDGNSLNNLNSNLVEMTNSEHIFSHRDLQKNVISLMKEGYVKFKDGNYYV